MKVRIMNAINCEYLYKDNNNSYPIDNPELLNLTIGDTFVDFEENTYLVLRKIMNLHDYEFVIIVEKNIL